METLGPTGVSEEPCTKVDETLPGEWTHYLS